MPKMAACWTEAWAPCLHSVAPFAAPHRASEAPPALGCAQVLDGLERGGGVPHDRLQAARDGYQHLQRGALRALSDLAALQKRMGQLLAQLQQVEAQGELVQQGGFTDPVQVLDKFREDRERARREVRWLAGWLAGWVGGAAHWLAAGWLPEINRNADSHAPAPAACRVQAALAADSEEAARQQAEALQQRLAHLTSKLGEAEDERRAELAPDIKAAKDEIAGLQGQLAAERAKAAAAQREASDIAARLETVGREQGGRAAGSWQWQCAYWEDWVAPLPGPGSSTCRG